ncbi:hypothetical protein CRYUN_Cryun12cG0107800 [Craigia yunnanensis]
MLASGLKSKIIKHHQERPCERNFQKASDQKPRKKTTQYPDMKCSSSYTSSTDSEEIDGSTIESSSSGQRSISRNSGTSQQKLEKKNGWF